MNMPAEIVRRALILRDAEDEVRRHRQVITQEIGDV
jgi:hypothetical protein